jgi:colicin import membrane protein
LTKADIKKAEAAARKAEKAASKPATEGKERLVPADLSHYVLHEDKTASGRRKIDIDDETAEKLRELDLEGTYKYAASVLDETAKELKARYANLNLGMQRMNLGNRIRKAFRVAAEAAEDTKEMKAA